MSRSRFPRNEYDCDRLDIRDEFCAEELHKIVSGEEFSRGLTPAKGFHHEDTKTRSSPRRAKKIRFLCRREYKKQRQDF